MIRRSLLSWCVTAGLLLATPGSFAHPSPQSTAENHAMASDLRLQSLDVSAQRVVMLDAASQKEVKVAQHGKFGGWTLMAALREPDGDAAVFENVEDRKGSIVYVTKQGVILALPKSLEPTSAAQDSLYRGRTMEEIAKTKRDVLGAELLQGMMTRIMRTSPRRCRLCACRVCGTSGFRRQADLRLWRIQ